MSKLFNKNDIVVPTDFASMEYGPCGIEGTELKVLGYKNDNGIVDEKGNNMEVQIMNGERKGSKYFVNDTFFTKVEEIKVDKKKTVTIKGFKATDKNMCCIDEQYHMGMNIYSGNKILEGASGIHCAMNLCDVFRKYPLDPALGNRYFEVEMTVREIDVNNINEHNTKIVASKVDFQKEITYSAEVVEAAYFAAQRQKEWEAKRQAHLEAIAANQQ